jgi:hypothetical protein
LDFLWKSCVHSICSFPHFFTDFFKCVVLSERKLISYIFWLLIPHQMYTWQRFSSFLWAVSSMWWQFLLLCRSL